MSLSERELEVVNVAQINTTQHQGMSPVELAWCLVLSRLMKIDLGTVVGAVREAEDDMVTRNR